MNDIKSGIQYMFQTHNSMTLAVSGTGHTAMECAIFNAVEPGESVLAAVNGIWGERASDMAERIGALRSCHLSNDGITILRKSWLNTMCVKPTGARVNTIVAPPGGYLTNAEIEQVLCLNSPVNYCQSCSLSDSIVTSVQALSKHRPVLFFLAHGESSTGVLHPLDGIGQLCHK